MNLILITLQRTALTAVAFLVIWFVVLQFVDPFSERLSVFLVAIAVYLVATYLFLPRLIYAGVSLLRKGRIPRYTHTRDGLLADPINIILLGTEESLLEAFHRAGWERAHRLSLKSVWKMGIAFLAKRPYPQAPFSSLYLFGRSHDYGFQEAIGDSPRKRHHIRFWAATIPPKIDINNILFWIDKSPVDRTQPLMWIGAGSKDVGFGLARLTYQFTHSVDARIDEERRYIIHSLVAVKKIKEVNHLESDTHIIGKYISDSRIAIARLS